MTYLEHVKKATGVPRDIARAADLVGSRGGADVQRFFDRVTAGVSQDIPYGTGTLVGAAAGGAVGLVKGHMWLGAIAGASLGHNLPALMTKDRRLAMVNMGETGFAVACSLASKQHPFWGFVVGRLIAGAVSHYAELRK